MLIRIVVLCFFALTVVSGVVASGTWTTLEDSRLLAKRANDGDSFHIAAGHKEYIFRLYFVDAPETTTEFRDRIEEQAKYFGVNVDQLVKLGSLAKAFTREKLAGPFVIHTRWEDAMGRSRMQRFYANVQTATGDLGEQLVENGLARVHGIQAEPEGITAARQEWQKLETLERKAKREKVGGWGASEGHMTTKAQNPQTKGSDAFDAFFHPERIGQNAASMPTDAWPFPKRSPTSTTNVTAAPIAAGTATAAKLDINTASEAELENLPGIGPTIAGRIIAARPFKQADDLRNVKGIGDKKYEQLRPYFN